MKRRLFLPVGLLALAAGLIAVGIMTGENTVVWRKAINICMECIGLG